MSETMLTPQEVAQQLKVSTRTIKNWCESGVLKGIKIGATWRVYPGQIPTMEQLKRQEEAQEANSPVQNQ